MGDSLVAARQASKDRRHIRPRGDQAAATQRGGHGFATAQFQHKKASAEDGASP